MRKFLSIVIAILATLAPAYAATAAQLQTTINNYGLTAAVSGSTVTVTGTKTDATPLRLTINAGVTVVWQASLTGKGLPSGLVALDGDGTLEVQSGKIENTDDGRSIWNDGKGTVNIKGGTVNGCTAIETDNNGTVNISNGTVSSTGGYNCYAIENSNGSTLNISGGTVSNTTGVAVSNYNTGKITVSGTAKVTSANTSTQGTIYLEGTATTQIEITGGTVENTASGNAICNNSTGGILLSGNPAITGTIMKAGSGVLSVNSSFNPVSKTYTLGFSNSSGVAVAGGASKLEFFSLASSSINGVTVSLSGQGNDLVLATTNGYAVVKSGTTYTITKGTGTYPSIQGAIDNIRVQSAGAATTIKFGDGNNVLDIGTEYITFDGAASPAWGQINLAGKITSKTDNYYYGTINLSNGVSISSTADIANTISQIYSDKSVVVRNYGTLSINGGTISGTDAVYNYGTGTVNISGGTISATRYYAIYNNSTGTVNISGGTVSTTTGEAVYNVYTGTVNISGGTVSATTGRAVYNYNTGKITVSGTAKVTSANVTSSSGTIVIANYGTATEARLEITGGMVENTAANANARAIYNNSTGAVSISGGMVSAKQGYAVYKNSTGITTITGGLVFAYGTAATDVIYGTYAAASGNPAIIAWDYETAWKNKVPTYTALTNDDIFVVSPATAKWDVRGGIAYANGANMGFTNTGFIAIDGVTVNATGTTPSSSSGAPSSSSGDPSSSSGDDTPIISLPQIASGPLFVYATSNTIIIGNMPRNIKVEVYSLQGKKIYSSYSENSQILRIMVLTKGMYVVKIGSQTVRVVVR